MSMLRPFFLLSLATAIGCSASVEPETVELEVSELSLPAPEVPDVIAVPEGQRLAFVLDAEGQQLYVCAATATGYGWTFVAPEADLLKANGHFAGTHYVGPTWEARDGSSVVAARVAGYSADPSAIPWLLLSAVSHGGHGVMQRVSYIHRLDTEGGIAPATGCDVDHVGEEQGVDYVATYYFYVAKP